VNRNNNNNNNNNLIYTISTSLLSHSEVGIPQTTSRRH